VTVFEIPSTVLAALNLQVYARQHKELVCDALKRLGVVHPLFSLFMSRFEGPFWSASQGYELIDLIEGTPSVVSSTLECRNEFQFPIHYIVLSAISANQILVLDSHLDVVYEVDFEGGDQLLLEGKLEPRWRSYSSFLADYFSS
jgi:hypothetical protein